MQLFLLTISSFSLRLHRGEELSIPRVSEVASTTDTCRISVDYGATACAVFAESLVQMLTWAKTATLQRELRRMGIRRPVFDILLRDGTK